MTTASDTITHTAPRRPAAEDPDRAYDDFPGLEPFEVRLARREAKRDRDVMGLGRALDAAARRRHRADWHRYLKAQKRVAFIDRASRFAFAQRTEDLINTLRAFASEGLRGVDATIEGRRTAEGVRGNPRTVTAAVAVQGAAGRAVSERIAEFMLHPPIAEDHADGDLVEVVVAVGDDPVWGPSASLTILQADGLRWTSRWVGSAEVAALMAARVPIPRRLVGNGEGVAHSLARRSAPEAPADASASELHRAITATENSVRGRAPYLDPLDWGFELKGTIAGGVARIGVAPDVVLPSYRVA